jgi:hypothetical protein
MTTTASAAPPSSSWEASIEVELIQLRREVERLSAEVLKLGGKVNVLMKERDERQRHGAKQR